MKLLLFLCIITTTSVSGQQSSMSSNKTLLHWTEADTVPDINCLVYKIPLSAIQVSNPETQLNSEIISFSIPGLLSTLYPVELRLLLDQRFPPHKMINHDTLTSNELYAATIYRSLPKAKLVINGQFFSGTIRLYSHSYWYDLGQHPYPSLSLLINYYVDGVLQKTDTAYDVGSLCGDWSMVRPS